MRPVEIKNVAVVGHGGIGAGIAQAFAHSGKKVSLVGRNEIHLGDALRKIKDNLELFVEMEMMKSGEVTKVLDRISPTTDLESACRQAQFLTEAVPEIMDLKQQIFRQADQWCPAEAILASCTSTFSVQEIGSSTRRPDRVIGTHWVGPSHIVQLVEIIRSPSTSEETISFTKELLENIGKVPVMCNEYPGHMHNAMQYALSRVALDLWEKGIATPEDIDKAASHGLGFRMLSIGPIGRLDLAGLNGFKNNWESIDKKTGSLGPFPQFLQTIIDQGRDGLRECSKDEMRTITRDRNRLLIQRLRKLERMP